MNVGGDLRTAVRLSLVVGVGFLLAASLVLADADLNGEGFFAAALKCQALLGLLVCSMGVALWFRRSWARTATLGLLRVGTGAVVAWYVYVVFHFTDKTSLPGVFSFLILAFWLRVFHEGVKYLNRPSVLAELGSRVQ